jgi:hypothetical protein
MPFWKRLFIFFTQRDSPEAKKKRLLKRIRQDIKSSRYSRFFKIKTGEIQPAAAKFLYEIYKTTNAASILLENAAQSGQLKEITVRALMDMAEKEREAALSDTAIEEQAEKAGLQGFADVVKWTREETETLINAFDPARIKDADRCYSLIFAFIQFISFDFYCFLKKFDPSLQERNFNSVPHFKPVKADLLIDMLKDFLEGAFAMDPDQNWQAALPVMKTYKNGVDVINGDQWQKLLTQLRDIRNSQILELIVRYTDRNPAWEPHAAIPYVPIANSWLESKKTNVENTIVRLVDLKRNAQVDALSREVFGGADIVRLKNYTEDVSSLFFKGKFEGFTHTRELNFFKAFLQDHFHRDIRDLCELLLVRGKWMSPALSLPLSDQFNAMLSLSDRLIRFDDNLGENSGRLRKALRLAGRNKAQARYIRTMLSQANEEADDMIMLGVQLLPALGQSLKDILEDYQKTTPQLIINWKEIEFAVLTPMGQWITEMGKSISSFLQILRTFMQTSQEVS